MYLFGIANRVAQLSFQRTLRCFHMCCRLRRVFAFQPDLRAVDIE
jgi:hypothetical protein